MVSAFWKIVYVLGLVFVASSPGCFCKNVNKIKSEILEALVSKDQIDTLILPGNSSEGEGPMTVQVGIHVRRIEKFDEANSELTYSIILRLKWIDYRLRYDNANLFDYIAVNDNFEMIWTPDIYIPGVKKIRSFDLPSPSTFTRIYPNGTVWTSRRVGLIHECPMNLERYPFDSQVCRFKISTYGSTKRDIVLQWYKQPTISKNANLPLLDLVKYVTFDDDQVVTETGEYDALKIDFLFARRLNYYAVRCFIPCSMLVVLTWISFWISAQHATLRISVCLACLLTMALAVQSLGTLVPAVSHETALDVFTGTCLTFIMVAVILQIILSRKLCESGQEKGAVSNGIESKGKDDGSEEAGLKNFACKLRREAFRSENAVAIAYAFVFLVFLAIYFGVYYLGRDVDGE